MESFQMELFGKFINFRKKNHERICGANYARFIKRISEEIVEGNRCRFWEINLKDFLGNFLQKVPESEGIPRKL